MTRTLLIGVDCATKDARTGVAFGSSERGRCRIDDATLANEFGEDLHLVLHRRMQQAERVLIAIDSPLGWPKALGSALGEHQAGDALPPLDTDAFFVRACDRHVHRTLGKKPLEVGADRIARTARRALQLLSDLRAEEGTRVPLAWDPDFPGQFAAIEVYPAATLIAHGARSHGYKRAADAKARAAILERLRELAQIEHEAEQRALVEPDALDAMVCVLAAHDFLSGACDAPADLQCARKEGWIWFRRRCPS